jgi:hypothetical protein
MNEIRIKLANINGSTYKNYGSTYKIYKILTLNFILDHFNYNHITKELLYSQDGIFRDEVIEELSVIQRNGILDSTYYNNGKDFELSLETLVMLFDNNILNYTPKQIKDILEYLQNM